MRLDQRSIDLLGIDDAELLAHGLDQTAQAEIALAPQQTPAGAHNERQRFGGEGVAGRPGHRLIVKTLAPWTLDALTDA